jgi:hypothetical protein
MSDFERQVRDLGFKMFNFFKYEISIPAECVANSQGSTTDFWHYNVPPLWSGGQSFWLQIQRSRVRLPALPDFLRSSGSGMGSTQPREDN